jgi:tRNA/tmRNA/rRNA uracil-C5-methylase (TrmA/RlmC/RlmD family)
VSRRRRDTRPLSREPSPARVDGFTHGGEGVVRLEGKAVFVPGALPGERIVVRVVDDRASWARAELVEVVEASPDRVEVPLGDPDALGGGDLAHATPEAGRRLKTRVVREQLGRLGRVEDPPVADCLPVGPDQRYRTTVRLHAGADGRLGFHRGGSHEVVPVDDLVLATPQVQALRDAVGDRTGAAEVTLRAFASTGTAAAVLVPGAGPLEIPEGAFDVVLQQPGGAQLPLRGEGVLAETVAGLTYRFDTSSFFQVSTGGAEALVTHVLDAVGPVDGALVWDLYAGVGLLSLPLARAGAEVLAVEGHEPATRWAGENAAEAGLTLTVEHAPVAELVAEGGTRADPPEVVVLDPPRTGAGAEVIAALLDLGPDTVVYVACDVAALARDTRALTEGGYQLVGAQPLDLFPLTHHVEVVATFRR